MVARVFVVNGVHYHVRERPGRDTRIDITRDGGAPKHGYTTIPLNILQKIFNVVPNDCVRLEKNKLLLLFVPPENKCQHDLGRAEMIKLYPTWQQKANKHTEGGTFESESEPEPCLRALAVMLFAAALYTIVKV